MSKITKPAIFFLEIIGFHIVVLVTLSFIVQKCGIYIPMETQLLLGEIPLLLPLIINKVPAADGSLIKLSNTFKNSALTVICTSLITPLALFFNLLSQLLTTNTVYNSSNQIIAGNAALMVLLMCIISPILEEVCYRGYIFNEYYGKTQPIKAIIISALLFGLSHLNFNQFCYTFVLGIFFVVLNMCSGNIYTSILSHVLINGVNMLLLYVLSTHTQETNVDTGISVLIGVFFVLAIVCTPLCYLCLNKLAIINNRPAIKTIILSKEPTSKIISIPLIIGIIVCLLLFLL